MIDFILIVLPLKVWYFHKNWKITALKKKTGLVCLNVDFLHLSFNLQIESHYSVFI